MDGRSLVRAVVIDQYMHTIVTVDQVGRPTSNPASAQPTLQRLGDMSAALRRRRGRRAGAHQPPGIVSLDARRVGRLACSGPARDPRRVSL